MFEPKIILTKAELWEFYEDALANGFDAAIQRMFANFATAQHEPLKHHFADEGPR